MKLSAFKSILGAFCALALMPSLVSAVEIGDVMTNVMKGETSLYKKVATGKGTQADADKLATELKGLKGTKAPKGEQAAFEKKVEALIKASEEVAAKKPDALKQLQTAGNCKGCHSEHREI